MAFRAARERRSAWSPPTVFAIIVGQLLGAHLPERIVKIGAAIIFFVFGVLLIAEGLAERRRPAGSPPADARIR